MIMGTNSNGSAAIAIHGQMSAPAAPAATVRASTIEPQSMAELRDFASVASKSAFFGMSAEQAMIVAMAGRDLGFSVTQALRAFHVIKGKASLSADGMVAACLQHRGLCEYFRPVEVTDKSATWETRRVGQEPTRYTFSMQDAERAGLVNDMYRRHPRRMLSARAKSYLARDVYPEILMGLVEDDEAEEIARRGAPAQYVEAHVAEPIAPPDGSIVDALLEAIAAVQSHADLVAVAARIRTLKDDGRVTEAQRKLIGARYREAQKAHPAPSKAAPAAPPVVHDAEIVEPVPASDDGARQPGED